MRAILPAVAAARSVQEAGLGRYKGEIGSGWRPSRVSALVPEIGFRWGILIFEIDSQLITASNDTSSPTTDLHSFCLLG